MSNSIVTWIIDAPASFYHNRYPSVVIGLIDNIDEQQNYDDGNMDNECQSFISTQLVL